MKPLLALTVAVLVFGACVDARDRSVPAAGPGDRGEPTCEDRDGDGYGEGCSQGGDCNDRDPNVHVGCTRCVAPADGCDCDQGTAPVSCYVDPTLTPEGNVMCHEGTRYCREGRWSACESIVSYPQPEELDTQQIVDPNAATQHCNDCSVNCFVVHDNLDASDAGVKSTSTNIASPKGGGLTLNAVAPDGGSSGSGPTFDPTTCVLGTAPDQDCDGIPDVYDPYPLQKPFATANPTIFLDVAPGETGVGVVNLTFYLNSADVYFMIDQTASMLGERDQLKADLTTGDFVNDPSYDCADYDFDFKPNNELKNQGIIGAVRCMIRDANFGVGYFREIPIYYASKDNVTYRNLQDITSSIPSVVAAVNKLDVVGNVDWPEASMLGLYAMVTGNGYYFGVDRTGLAPRTDCPSLTFGYPCFRNSAIPIVLMFTDAQFHQGPANNDYPYTSSVLGINAGTTTTHTPVPATNETYGSAYDLGDLGNANLTLIGDTTKMAFDIDSSQTTCGSSDDKAPDAMFKFTLGASKTVTATTWGSSFDTTLSIFSGTPAVATALPSYPNTNDTTASAYAFNTINNKFVQASGDSSSLVHDYSANDVGCGSASDAKDATFTFNLSTGTRVALSTRGSSYGTTMALFSAAPVTTSYTTINNTNDTAATEYAVGSLTGTNKGFTGSTSAAGITANYTANQLGCGTLTADAATDAVYSFSLGSATRVRISGEDSPLKAALVLTSDNGSYLTPAPAGSSIETAATAYNVGNLDNTAFQFTGDTRGMHADYPGSLTSCGTGDTSNDAVFKFTLANQQTVDIDTLNSTFDTSISLFRSTVGTAGTTFNASNNTNETASSAFDLGTLNGKIISTTGASTSNMAADYTSTQIGCSSSSSARDAVYKFTLTSPTRVRVDTNGSSFDTVASLHSGLPVQSITTLSSKTNEAVASALGVTANATTNSFQSFDSSTGTMTADVNVNASSSCTAAYSAKDAVFKLNVATAGNYEINTDGSLFDTVLGLYPSTVSDAAPPTPSAQGSNGDTKAAAVNVGTLDGRWAAYSGSTTGLAANNSYANCSAAASSADVYYKFTLNTKRTVVIDTIGSGFDTVLALTTSADVEITCNNDAVGTDSQITRLLDPGTYYVFIKGRTSGAKGAYNLRFRDTVVTDISNTLACDDNSGSGGFTSKISSSLAVGTYYVVVKGRTATDSGNYRLTVKNLDALSAPNRLTCDNDSGSGTASLFEQDLVAGDYFIIVSGTSSSARGSYSLRVQDITSLPGLVTCNDDYTGRTSRINPTLSAGTYYLVVKGYGSATGVYTLTMRDSDVQSTTNYACDVSSGPSGKALIEQDLAAGNYRVVVKGVTAADKGNYKVIMRDLGAVPTSRLQCDATSGGAGSSYIERDLTAGTYTVVLQSSSSTGSGAYQLSVRDITKIPNNLAVSCSNDISGSTTSRISQSLNAGTYYALVKGNTSADKGIYQLNIGTTPTTASTFVPPTWTQTQTALNAKSVRVIPVLSCHDDPSHGDVQGDCVATRTQAKALANATGALGSNLQPLVFDIDGDGGGLSKTVVTGIGALAHYLEMNVSVRVVFDPDPNPGFQVSVKAVDSPGDGCSGLVGIEHQHCVPGASPRFELSFLNPKNAPVPANSKDPNGGYNFRAELIGDQQFIVDKVPIYIIPHDVSPAPPAPLYVPSGNYWQDLTASGCTGTQRPDWHDLTWNADIPEGTSISFAVCASDDQTQLAKCTPTPLCTVTGGKACSQDSDCINGYCSAKNSCQFVSAGSCSSDKDCSRGATCKTGGVCRFAGQPVYIGDVLKQNNYTSNLRMNIGLNANTTNNTAPIVYDWSLNYVCNSAQ